MLRARLKLLTKQREERAAAEAALLRADPAFLDDDDPAVAEPEPAQETSNFFSIVQQVLNCESFDVRNPEKFISRHRLSPSQKTTLISWLYREEGKVPREMILMMASFFRVPLDRADMMEIDGDARSAGYQQQSAEKSRQVALEHDSDSEPDPDEPVKGKKVTPKFVSRSGYAMETIHKLVGLLRRELRALYRDVIKNETKIRIAKDDADGKRDVPSYTQQKTIADSLQEFERMSQIRLFGNRNTQFRTGAVSQESVALSFPSMSLSSDRGSCKDETGSISAASQSTVFRPESAFSTVSPGYAMPVMSSASHPLKNPDVFQHFYPSVVSDETRKLPIFTHADRIITIMSSRRVTVVSGRTGTGKTTQVPLMVLDQCAQDKTPCNIIVTQPRRLAAVGVARRVCADRRWPVGQLVGYHVGLDKMTSSSTRLTYCTTGVFIEKIISQKHLNSFTHVFLDEVHERDQDTDMALMLVRQMMRENSPEVKVILMSATVEVNKMIRYFTQNLSTFTALDQPGSVNINTSCHEIHEHFLDEFSEHIDLFDFDLQNPRLPHRLLVEAAETLDHLEPLCSDRRLDSICVLVFLPGLEHINELAELIKSRNGDTEVLVLHSVVSGTDQEKVLDPPVCGVRRVILSTNIAESSLTISYIDYVFDFCLTKGIRRNCRSNLPQLVLDWASVSNCQQRKGRVGRVRSGRVYFFVPRKFFDEDLPKHPDPEILVAPMENTVLRVKQLRVAPPPAEVLILFPDPPKRNDVEVAILTLKEAGALTVESNGLPSYSDGELTVMGQLMARFPLNIRTTKFIIFCCIFGYAYEGVTVASGMTVESLLSSKNRIASARCKKVHDLYSKNGVASDPLAALYGYERWNAEYSKGSFKSRVDEESWCESNLLDLSRMKEFVALRREVWHRLTQLFPFADAPSVQTYPVETIIPLLLAGSFFPNILVNQNTINDMKVGKELIGYNHLHTCIIPKFGFSSACQAPLYDSQLKATLELNTDRDSVARIIYGSSETFICFSRYAGNVVNRPASSTELHRGLEILKARMVSLRGTINLRDQVMSAELKSSMAQVDSGSCEVDTRFCLRENVVRLPPAEIPTQPGKKWPVLIENSLQLENIEKLWIARDDPEMTARQVDLDISIINLASQNALRPVRSQDILLFSSYLSRHPTEENSFARVTVVGPKDSAGNVQVLLVDNGTVDEIPASFLRILPAPARTAPRSCFEFIFSELRFVTSKKVAANTYFTQLTDAADSQFFLEVHSILDDVVHGVIFWTCASLHGTVVNLNQELVKLGYAYHGPESWISQYDNKRRLNGSLCALASSNNASQKEIPQPELKSQSVDVVSIGPLYFPARSNLQTIGRTTLSAFIEPASLNSFTYDKYPQDKCWPYRPVVAASLQHSGAREMLKCSSATSLPVQPGLLGILAMVFAPYVEMVMSGDTFDGLLTGLGPFPGKTHSFYPDCEVELPFDGDMAFEDVVEVNLLRSKINSALRLIIDETCSSRTVDMDPLQRSCVHILTNLLDKPRLIKPPTGRGAKYAWINTNHGSTEETDTLTFLTAIQYPPIEGDGPDLLANVVALHHAARRFLTNETAGNFNEDESRCLLCNSQLGNPVLLVSHVFGDEHQAKEQILFGNRPNSLVV